MDLNIDCINIELNNIIRNVNKKHNHKTILHALVAIDCIDMIYKTHKIVYNFIQALKYLKNKIDCYIDFEFLEYAYHNKKKIILYESDIITQFDSKLIYAPLHDCIDNMLKSDALLLNAIINESVSDIVYDEYGEVDDFTVQLLKKLFKLLDRDRDGYINALDALHIIEMHEKYILVFEHNFIDNVLQILIINGKLDFNTFFKNVL